MTRRGHEQKSGPLLSVIFASVLAVWLCVLTVGASAQGGQAGNPSVMIVFDGSGSMWGRLPGTQQAKFEAVREALRQTVLSARAGVNPGLVTFGLSTRGSCASAQIAVTPNQDSAAEVLSRLERFNPQGRGPVTLGLQTAVEALGKSPGPRHIILVHDDPDNCQQDACSALAGFQAALPGLRIHSLFLAPKPQQRGQMACLAKTGGRVFEIDDADDLTSAATQLASLIATSSAGGTERGPAATDTTQSTDGAPSPPQARAVTPGLELIATLSPDAAPLKQGVVWRVTTEDGKPAVPAGQLRGGRPSVALKPGRYIVEAAAGTWRVRETVTVDDGQRTRFTANFNAGRMILGATLKPGAPPLAEAVFVITALDDPNAPPAWFGTAPATPLFLKPGRYRVAVSAGRVAQQRDVDLKLGQTIDQRVSLGGGRLGLSAKSPRGLGGQPLSFTVAVDDPARPSGRRVIARSAALAPEFLLPAGTYYVSAAQGGTIAHELIGIEAGASIKKVLDLGAMRLTLRHRLKGQDGLPDASVKTTIWRLGRKQYASLVGRSAQKDPTFRLAPGRYRVRSELGSQNARILRQFTVGNDAAGDLVLEHVAGTLQLSIAREAGNVDADQIYWRIHDSTGKAVFRATDAAPKAVLNVGTYVIALDIGSSQFRDTVVITSGQHVDLTLGRAK